MFALLFILTFSFSSRIRGEEDPYGGTEASHYLTGNFNPARHPSFVSLDGGSVPVNRKGHYLRKETLGALERMVAGFHREHPGIRITVISATRNFRAQAGIWGAKWNGTRKVEGKSLPAVYPDPVARAKKILEFSSMPGTSRHHWGTDLDLNALNNGYFTRGDGLVFYNWMVLHAHEYGFCQPYTSGRSRGYEEEKWHWSYKPISSFLTREWNSRFQSSPEKILQIGTFPGAKESIGFAPDYVNGINPGCLSGE